MMWLFLQTVIGEDGQEVPKTIDDIDDPNYYRYILRVKDKYHCGSELAIGEDSPLSLPISKLS